MVNGTVEPPMKRLKVGEVLAGRYLLAHPISSRGSSLVYAALDERLGREVVVKLPVAGGRQTALTEAESLRHLQHPNNIRILDYGEAGCEGERRAFIVLEHFDVPNLRSILNEFRRIAPNDAVDIVRQVLQALDEAHGCGLVHGDIKPENILVAREGPAAGHVKVVDYGLGSGAGTPQYMAPELINGAPRSPATDVYAVGATLYECIAGRRAHDADAPEQVLKSVVTSPHHALTDLVPTSPQLAAIVHRAMRPSPAERFQSAQQMLGALGELDPAGLEAYDLGAFSSNQTQESLLTLESAPELAKSADLADDALVVELRSSQRPTIWVLAGDPGLRRPEVSSLVEHLSQTCDVRALDEDERFDARWNADFEATGQPWLVIFGGLHVAVEDPLLAELRDRSEAGKVLVLTHPNVEIVQTAIDWCGLDRLICLPASTEALVSTFNGIIERRRHLHQHYDCLRLALRDAREDRARIERLREIDS